MKTEDLVKLGLTEDVAAKVLELSGKETGQLTQEVAKLKGEAEGLQAQLSAANEVLKSFEGIDPKDLNEKLAMAQQALKDTEAKYTADIAARDSRAETERFLAGHKFINDITQKHFVDAIEVALADVANKGKNRQDIFTALTNDEDGKPKAGIFAAETPKRQFTLPPSGNVEAGGTDDLAATVAARIASAKSEQGE